MNPRIAKPYTLLHRYPKDQQTIAMAGPQNYLLKTACTCKAMPIRPTYLQIKLEARVKTTVQTTLIPARGFMNTRKRRTQDSALSFHKLLRRSQSPHSMQHQPTAKKPLYLPLSSYKQSKTIAAQYSKKLPPNRNQMRYPSQPSIFCSL